MTIVGCGSADCFLQDDKLPSRPLPLFHPCASRFGHFCFVHLLEITLIFVCFKWVFLILLLCFSKSLTPSAPFSPCFPACSDQMLGCLYVWYIVPKPFVQWADGWWVSLHFMFHPHPKDVWWIFTFSVVFQTIICRGESFDLYFRYHSCVLGLYTFCFHFYIRREGDVFQKSVLEITSVVLYYTW